MGEYATGQTPRLGDVVRTQQAGEGRTVATLVGVVVETPTAKSPTTVSVRLVVARVDVLPEPGAEDQTKLRDFVYAPPYEGGEVYEMQLSETQLVA